MTPLMPACTCSSPNLKGRSLHVIQVYSVVDFVAGFVTESVLPVVAAAVVSFLLPVASLEEDGRDLSA